MLVQPVFFAGKSETFRILNVYKNKTTRIPTGLWLFRFASGAEQLHRIVFMAEEESEGLSAAGQTGG